MIMFENPWKQDKIDKQGEEYIKKYKGESDKDFSWILDGDKEAIESVYDDNNNKDKQSIDWGLPNQVVGDPDTATFFLCLLNPRVQDADSPYDDFKGYVSKESKGNSDEYFTEKELSKYYQHIIHSKENELSKEIREMKKGNLIERLSKFDKEYKEIKAVDSEKANLFEKHNNPLRSQYYLYTYYYKMLEKNDNSQGNRRAIQVGLYQDNHSVEQLNELNICDLELFAYRTESKPNKKLNYLELESSRYAASLIINRINNIKKDEKLVFFFRSYKEWAKVIFEVLGEMTGLTGDALKEKYDSLAKYFYVGSSTQKMIISENNICKAPKEIEGKATDKISRDEYEEFKNMFKY